MNHDEHRPTSPGVSSENKRVKTSGMIVIALAALGLVIYLVTDHLPHVLAALPYAGIIAVVAVHLLMHRGHSHGGRNTTGHDHRET
jgi:hypothetical protein